MLNKNRNKKTAPDAPEDTPLQHLKCSLDSNISAFKTIFKNDDTIIFREISNISSKGFHACLMLLDGMASTDIINKSVIDPIMKADMKGAENGSDIPCLLISKIIPSSQITVTATVEDILLSLFSGDAALLIDGCCDALLIGCKEMRERALEEPGLEKALRGPKEGFTETMMTNLLLLRRRLKTPDLKLKYKELGVRTKTKICICYIENLAREDILTELESRLDRINTDGIIDANSIEELIKDSPLSPFKTIGNTERPDVAVAKLLEGRIAVIVDGTPSVLTLPFVFMEYFQTADDYYINYWMSSFNRLLRCLSEFFTTSIPAIYVALTTYHQEMIPTPLLLSITASRQDIPFPTIIEALILLFLFEVIREAGIRMPAPMGQSVSIVGALILGEAAIEARLFSAPMVVVVAATGITSLITIKLKGAAIILRLLLLLLSAYLGLYGYIFGVIGAFIYLFSMRSFGVPYMLEYGSVYATDLKDVFIRAPWWYMKTRPKPISPDNIIRQQAPEIKDRDSI
jgi:spore germination protein KA